MITIIKTTNKDPYSAIDHTKPGKQVITDPKGKVLKVVTVCPESQTDQSFAKSHNINNLIANAEAKGLLRAVNKFEGEMDDFPAYDFQEAQDHMARAQSMFEQMPAGVRTKFRTPAAFMQYVNNPNNRKELETMGFANGFDNLDHQGNIINPSYTPPQPEAPATGYINPPQVEPTPAPAE